MPSPEPARAIARRLKEAGHEALFVGGCVRDRLRGVEPKDFDLATSAAPEEVRALFAHTLAVGAAFGVTVVVEGGTPVEVATFRWDRGVFDGRHPKDVVFGASAQKDALRRDFTINGLFEDPESGAVSDYVGGRADLAAGLVRCIGDPALRFREDRLRMLRAVRFATGFDFRIEARTRAAIEKAAPQAAGVSTERCRDELLRIVLSGRGGRGVGLLKETGLLEVLLPEVAAMDGVVQPARFHPEGDVLSHTRLLLDDYRGRDPVIALSALLHDVGKPPTACINAKGRPAFPNHALLGAAMAASILKRLRFPNRTIQQVEELVARHMDWPSLPRMRPAKQRRFLLREDFDRHHELHRLDCRACHGNLSVFRFAAAERARLLAAPPPVRPLLDGYALKAMGFVPGPSFSRMLRALVDAQLVGAVADPSQARAFLLERFAPPDGRPVAGEQEA